MFSNIIKQDFFLLLQAGLWEKDLQHISLNREEILCIQKISQEQAVVGMIAAGIEHTAKSSLPKDVVLDIAGSVLQIEQRNTAMNYFIGVLVDNMRKEGIYALLVKGQGVAQCYERPLWRVCGDVDFLLSYENYEKAKRYLSSIASYVETEDKRRLHLGMTIDPWTVELHGTMRTEVSNRIDKVIDDVQNSIFYGGSVRSWNNDSIQVFLPSADNSVIIVFTHFIDHFYGEGIGVRQVCDWVRLLWKYKNEIDQRLLEKRIRSMRLMTEWKAFASFAVYYLGMPEEAMPFYSNSKLYRSKANKICDLILETGNLGQNKDNSYRQNNNKFNENLITFFRRLGEFARIATIFPLDSPRFFMRYVINRLRAKSS